MNNHGSSRTPTRIVLLFIALWIGVSALSAAAAEATYEFAVVPQFEQRKLFTIWRPIVAELERLSGLRLHLVATLSVPEFEHELSRGTFDFVYANPYHIFREERRQGYLPLVRDSVPLRGILIVRKDSPVRDISELNGKRLAIPSPNAIGASMLLRAELERLHGVHLTPVNVKTHSSVYLHVANALVEAGGGVEKTLAEQPEQLRDALRVLYSTGEFASHPVAAHPRVPEAVREAVRRAFLEMAATPEGARLLAEIPITHLVSTSMADYEGLRALDLESYWVEESR